MLVRHDLDRPSGADGIERDYKEEEGSQNQKKKKKKKTKERKKPNRKEERDDTRSGEKVASTKRREITPKGNREEVETPSLEPGREEQNGKKRGKNINARGREKKGGTSSSQR